MRQNQTRIQLSCGGCSKCSSSPLALLCALTRLLSRHEGVTIENRDAFALPGRCSTISLGLWALITILGQYIDSSEDQSLE
jgi:hypothetical protein